MIFLHYSQEMSWMPKLAFGALKGESSSQACRSYMIVNVIVKDRQNFFFHFMIPPSAGGLPGQFVLA